jgi:hypothetical protein
LKIAAEVVVASQRALEFNAKIALETIADE